MPMQDSNSPQPRSADSLARIQRKAREGFEQAKADPDLQAMVDNLNRNALKACESSPVGCDLRESQCEVVPPTTAY